MPYTLMKTSSIRFTLLVSLACLMLTSELHAQQNNSKASEENKQEIDPNDAKKAFGRFQKLVGKHRTLEKPDVAARVEYELWSRDTALVENWFMVSGKREFTVFVIDNDRMIATHYCAADIQSTMLLQLPVKENVYEFKLESATNLPDPRKAHNSGFTYTFQNDGSFDRKEYWTKDGEVTESEQKIVRQ